MTGPPAERGGVGGGAPDVNDGEAGGLFCAEGAAAGVFLPGIARFPLTLAGSAV